MNPSPITRRHCGTVCAFTQSRGAGPAETGHVSCTPLHRRERGAPLGRSYPCEHKAEGMSVHGGSCAHACPHLSKCHFLVLVCHPGPPQPYSRARVRHVTPALQPLNSFTVKEIWVTHVLAQPPFFDLHTSSMGFKGDKTSCYTPLFAIRALTTQHHFISSPSPGNHTIIAFTLLKGVQILLPQPQKKVEPLEEQKGETVLKGAFPLSRGARAARMGAEI